MPDQRKTSRKSSFLAAYARNDPDGDALFCIVRDLSSKGARLETSAVDRLPGRFDLQINGRKALLHVEICWRTDREVGVRLLTRSPESRLVLAGRLEPGPVATAR